MANFRTHISFGIALGILGVIGMITATVTNAPSLVIAIFVAATLGSILPDMDSDSSVPFHITFGSFSIVAAVLTFFSIYKNVPRNWIILIVGTLGAGLLVWGAIGTVFKKFTRHRGMAHSIPAAILAGLITFFVASHFYFDDGQAFLLGLGMTGGYLIHLILDEVYAALNFHGTPFIPNKALGSALKLKSSNSLINLAMTGAILFLLAGNIKRLWGLAQTFWHTIS